MPKRTWIGFSERQIQEMADRAVAAYLRKADGTMTEARRGSQIKIVASIRQRLNTNSLGDRGARSDAAGGRRSTRLTTRGTATLEVLQLRAAIVAEGGTRNHAKRLSMTPSTASGCHFSGGLDSASGCGLLSGACPRPASRPRLQQHSAALAASPWRRSRASTGRASSIGTSLQRRAQTRRRTSRPSCRPCSTEARRRSWASRDADRTGGHGSLPRDHEVGHSGGAGRSLRMARRLPGTITPYTVTPRRITGSFRITREDEAMLDGLESALRENLGDVLSDQVDRQVVAGDNQSAELERIAYAAGRGDGPRSGCGELRSVCRGRGIAH